MIWKWNLHLQERTEFHYSEITDFYKYIRPIQIALNDSELRIYEICCHLKKNEKKIEKIGYVIFLFYLCGRKKNI